MYDKLLNYAALYIGVFGVIVITLMLVFAANQDIIYVNKLQGQENRNRSQVTVTMEHTKEKLTIIDDKSKIVDFSVPLNSEVNDKQVTIQNDYIEETLFLEIEGLPEGYFDQKSLSGNTGYVTEAYYQYKNGITNIELQMTGIYEHRVKLSNDILTLEFVEPKSMYDQIVVIDIDTENEHGKCNIELGETIKKLLEAEGIFGYYIDIEQGEEDKNNGVTIANKIEADMLINLHILEREKEEIDQVAKVKTMYNPDYFIHYFGSVELANIVEKNIAQQTGFYATGLEAAAKENSIVMEAKVPVAMVEFECVHQVNQDTEEKETLLDFVAQGIVLGILESFEYIDKEK